MPLWLIVYLAFNAGVYATFLVILRANDGDHGGWIGVLRGFVMAFAFGPFALAFIEFKSRQQFRQRGIA